MSKGNKVLVGILAFIVACVMGYALFSETITVTGTATASGSFNITPTCIEGKVATVPESYADTEGGYKNVVCTADDSTNAVVMSATFDYPTAKRYFTVKITNTGTINSLIASEIPIDGTKSKMCFSGDINADPSKTGDCTALADSGFNMKPYGLQIGNGTIHFLEENSGYGYAALPTEVQQAFSENGKIVLKPGNSVYYWTVLGAGAPELLEKYNNVLNSYIRFEFVADFDQALSN